MRQYNVSLSKKDTNRNLKQRYIYPTQKIHNGLSLRISPIKTVALLSGWVIIRIKHKLGPI